MQAVDRTTSRSGSKHEAEIAARRERLDELQPESAQAAGLITLLRSWLADDSGYDEETWPKLKKALDQDAAGWERLAYSMTDVVLLDAGPLGMISHPRASGEIVEWVASLVVSGVEVLIPEVADYEVRRELLHAGRGRGIARFGRAQGESRLCANQLRCDVGAAAFWADSRRRGRPTASDQSLDADVILAGQAAALNGRRVIVASSNPRHIARFVPAQRWQDISTPS